MGEDEIEITKEDLELFENNLDEQKESKQLEMMEKEEEKYRFQKTRENLEDNIGNRLKKIQNENEILRIQISSREREIEDLRKEVDELHSSISYRIGRSIAETSIGNVLKSFLKKHLFKS